MPIFKAVIVIVLALAWTRVSESATLTLAWNQSTDPNVAGYVLYWGTQSGVYSSQANVGNQSQVQVGGLADGTNYYFVISAYNATGQLSLPSPEVWGQTPVTATNVPIPSPTGTTGNPSILVTPTTVSPGGALTVSWNGMLPSAATDWLGLYQSAASDTAFSSWLYVSCAQQATSGKASGSCTMTVPASSTSGAYNVRLFRNDTYQRSATSSDLTVSTLSPRSPTPLPGPSVQVTPTTVTRDGTVTVSWSGLVAPTATDWFGLYQSTASDSAFLGWLYVNCTQVPSTPRASGSCSMTFPRLATGSYSLRLFSNNSYQRLASTSVNVAKK